MSERKKISISVGDVNGIGLEIILRSHEEICKLCHPIYCADLALFEKAARLLDLTLPKNLDINHLNAEVTIRPGRVSQDSGQYSFDSFLHAITLAETKQVDAMVTLPINKEAWGNAGINYKGHTDYLRDHFKQEAIMMLGCQELFVALYSEHIPLKDVVSSLNLNTLINFLRNFHTSTKFENIGVLGLNPHAGDGGVLGDEEEIIIEAIKSINKELGSDIFHGPLVPDTAFTPLSLQNCNRIVAMYHDQGLAPLKALYFDQSINVSLHLPIVRTSVDHGTAFDIAYKNKKPNCTSYINAIKAALGDL